MKELYSKYADKFPLTEEFLEDLQAAEEELPYIASLAWLGLPDGLKIAIITEARRIKEKMA